MRLGMGIWMGGAGAGGGAAPTIDAPVLTLDSPLTNPPTFSMDMDLPEVGDVIRLQIATDTLFADIVQEATNTLDAAEVADEEALFSLTPLAADTYYARVRHERGATLSGWSNSETFEIVSIQWATPDAYIASAGVRQYATPDAYIVETV